MELTFNIMMAVLTLYTAIHLAVIRWIKLLVDKETSLREKLVGKVRDDHRDLDRLIAKDYMDSTRTMEMYNIMAKHTDQRMTDIGKKIDKIDQKLDTILLERK